MDTTKESTFETALKAIGRGLEGYVKPNRAQIENTRNIPARAKSEYLEILVSGDNVSNEKLEISRRTKGRKYRSVTARFSRAHPPWLARRT
jgi:hypothetical protein